jgi:hypothetical protein
LPFPNQNSLRIDYRLSSSFLLIGLVIKPNLSFERNPFFSAWGLKKSMEILQGTG